MGDRAALAMARRELEDLYLGIPDESVNLTFEDLAQVKQSAGASQENRNPTVLEPIPRSALSKSPSLDFSRGFQETRINHHHQAEAAHALPSHRSNTSKISREKKMEFMQAVERSMAFDSVSVISMASMYQEDKAQRRRPGIPHSNICTICSNYVYIFRHRCLVCGRVYCGDCVIVGMGEMAEGRKCVQCLGKKFSQRYIKRAGMVGCCSRYASSVKQAELMWAEKGPRRSGERAYGGNTTMMSSTARIPTPTRPHASGNNTHSFVASSTYSPYNLNHHNLPI